MKTKRGIELDLSVSEFFLDFNNFRFYFSSKFYLEKFKENVYNFCKMENKKNSVKYMLNINGDIFYMISYYKQIEKRGFRIVDLINNKELSELNFTINLKL